MKYETPTKRSLNEIKSALLEKGLTDEEVSGLVLSAIYYVEPSAAADILFDQFKAAKVENKANLMVLFNTFYDIHKTTYRIEEGVNLLKAFQIEVPELFDRIQFVIDDVLWVKNCVVGMGRKAI